MAKGKFLLQLNKIYQANALAFLRSLPNNSIDMVITSPPYWCLRDYGVAGQLGLEPTFQEYVNKLCDIFDEVKRVLKKEGTCWVNLGDVYSTQSGAMRDCKFGPKQTNNQALIQPRTILSSKCLLQLPSRFAIEMCNRGWILRNEIIWHKPNCMPSSVKDRFTVDFEKIFFFSKNKKYYFEQQLEPLANSTINRARYGWKGTKERPKGVNAPGEVNEFGERSCPSKGRNKRCVWKIQPKGFPEAHFATYPEKLIETPIKAGCPPKGIVLDPFMGAGTTALTALKLGRNFLGCELNPAYIEIAEKRLAPYLDPFKEAA